MPRTKKPALPVGTPVAIDIAQGTSVAQGVVTAAEYDDGWLYRIDVTGGDRCDAHRNDSGELWVREFEVTPTGAPAVGSRTAPRHTVEVVGDLLVVLDEDGNGCDAYRLRSLRGAERQLRRWQDEYSFDYAEALRAFSEFFATR
jgi:hypothetical protein